MSQLPVVAAAVGNGFDSVSRFVRGPVTTGACGLRAPGRYGARLARSSELVCGPGGREFESRRSPSQDSCNRALLLAEIAEPSANQFTNHGDQFVRERGRQQGAVDAAGRTRHTVRASGTALFGQSGLDDSSVELCLGGSRVAGARV